MENWSTGAAEGGYESEEDCADSCCCGRELPWLMRRLSGGRCVRHQKMRHTRIRSLRRVVLYFSVMLVERSESQHSGDRGDSKRDVKTDLEKYRRPSCESSL